MIGTFKDASWDKVRVRSPETISNTHADVHMEVDVDVRAVCRIDKNFSDLPPCWS